jgi:AraC-like DNA-binding protein
MSAIPELLREFAQDPERVLAAVRVKSSVFDNPERWLPFATAGRMLEHCAAVTDCPHFGLLVGSRFDFATFGVLGRLMLNAPSVAHALSGLVRDMEVQDRGGTAYLHELDATRVALGYAVYEPRVAGIAQVLDCAIAVGHAMLRAMCGRSWRPIRIMLAHRHPPDAAPHRRCFGAPVHFDAPRSEIVFAARWLRQPIATAGAAPRGEIERLVAAAKKAHGSSFVESVRRAVQLLVPTGAISAAQVAKLLGVHGRSLRRRLQADGTNLHSLVRDVRFETARQLLRETRLPIGEIAVALRYADTSAFTRAFRAWAGVAPTQWRLRASGARCR